MSRWINRIAALIVYGAYVALYVVTDASPISTLGILSAFGLLVVLFGDTLVDHLGPTTQSLGTDAQGYGCIVSGFGWALLLLQGLWWAMVYVLYNL